MRGRFERESSRFEIGFQGIETILQAHGVLRSGVGAPRFAVAKVAYSLEKGYTVLVNIIYLPGKWIDFRS